MWERKGRGEYIKYICYQLKNYLYFIYEAKLNKFMVVVVVFDLGGKKHERSKHNHEHKV